MTNFGAIDNYAAFVKQDPFRNGLHYPAVLNHLPQPRQVPAHILDVGCGDGRLARMMANKGLQVTGYDRAPENIQKAQAAEDDHPFGINYEVAQPETYAAEELFDAATSVLVLPYATSIENLRTFFQSTCSRLMLGGKFISVVFNPSFEGFGKDLGSRRFHKLDGNQVQVEFIDPRSKETQFTSLLRQYTRAEYEQAALEGGMKTELWENLYATREAIEQMGEPFWAPCHEKQPYALHVARKSIALFALTEFY